MGAADVAFARGTRQASRMLASALGLAMFGLVGAAQGQAVHPRSHLDFNFSNPGARSLGFGGAFAPLADDATAAFANPAGLVQLVRPEVSLEARGWSSSAAFAAGGRFDGTPTGLGIDTRPGLLLAHESTSEAGPSFASAIWPRGRWTLALYAHELARADSFTESQGLFLGSGGFVREPASRDRAKLRLHTFGLAAGWRANDRWSFGLALVRFDLSFTARSELYGADPNRPESSYEPIPYTPDRLLGIGTMSIEGSDTTVSSGLLFTPHERVSIGLFLRPGASMTANAEVTRSGAPGRWPPVDDVTNVPSAAGAGLAWRSPSGRLTLAGQLDYLAYRGFLGSLVENFLGLHSRGNPEARPYQSAWEGHFGGEYALLSRRPVVAFRAGAWVDEHSGDLEHDRVLHMAGGVGVAGERLQVDLGADVSSVLDTVSLSVIYSF